MGKIQRAPRPGDEKLYPMGKMLLSFRTRDGVGEILSLEAHTGVNRYPFMIGVMVPKTLYPLYSQMMPHRAFGLNVPDAGLKEVVERCEQLAGTPGDKFQALGLTPRRGLMTETVLIDECPVVMELRLRQFWPMGDYDFIVGELVLAHTDNDVLERRQSLTWYQTPILRGVEGKHV